MNSDPIGFEGGSNWYGYAGGNPLMANDPSGLAVRQVGCTYKRKKEELEREWKAFQAGNG